MITKKEFEKNFFEKFGTKYDVKKCWVEKSRKLNRKMAKKINLDYFYCEKDEPTLFICIFQNSKNETFESVFLAIKKNENLDIKMIFGITPDDDWFWNPREYAKCIY